MCETQREIGEAAALGEVNAHGVGGGGGLEADAEEYDLLRRVLLSVPAALGSHTACCLNLVHPQEMQIKLTASRFGTARILRGTTSIRTVLFERPYSPIGKIL